MDQHLDRRFLLGGLAGAAGVSALAAMAKAGPLNPPAGAVAATGKTITEAEPRIAINATNTPGDADCIFRITQPGSYYLTAGFTLSAGKSGILVSASGVTIDLSGFSITGIGASGGAGVAAPTASATDLVVRDGRITGCNGGVGLTNNDRVTLERLTVVSCTGSGASVGVNCRILDCTFALNTGYGLNADARSVVARCIAAGNSNSGIRVNVEGHAGNTGAAVVTECIAEANSAIGIAARGVISRCFAFGNTTDGISADSGSTVTECSASENGASGIRIRETTMSNCTSYDNVQTGFSIYFFCHVSGCNAHRNGIGSASTSAAGFHLYGRLSRITDCVSGDNLFGFRNATSTADSNFFARNTAINNGTNWLLTAGNYAFIVSADVAAAVNGNTGGVSPGSTNPNANYTVVA